MRTLAQNDVHVWYLADDAAGESFLLRNSQVLSNAEAQRALEFRRPDDQRLYRLAHTLIRVALSEYASVDPIDWLFQTEEKGKPYVSWPTGNGLYFSISHTEGMVGCAIARVPKVGFDVEPRDRKVEVLPLAESVFSPQEIEFIRSIPSEDKRRECFMRIWTMKEAYIKATGEGLSARLTDITIELKNATQAKLSFLNGDSPQSWTIREIRAVERFLMAVVVETKTEPNIKVKSFN